jgi:hypothetical protein
MYVYVCVCMCMYVYVYDSNTFFRCHNTPALP